MLKWSLIFLVIALVSGLLGFGAISGIALGIAKILFYVFLFLAIILLIVGTIFVKKVKKTIDKTFSSEE